MATQISDSLFVTGANGHLGQALARACAAEDPPRRIRAAVRSQRAAATLEALPPEIRPEIRLVDYADPVSLAEAGDGCEAWVHLVGILKESAAARYEDAHEGTIGPLVEAAAKVGVRRIVYPSILGSDPDASNRCLASKGRAEAMLLEGPVPATVLRVPMVLGPDELPAAALRGQAMAPFVFMVRGGASLEQPIDTLDVVDAVIAAARDRGDASFALDLAGPESLPRRELLRRVATILGGNPRIVPLPMSLVRGLAALFERVSSNPPLTVAMLGVLEHDDAIDPAPAAARLGISLRPLKDTLERTFAPPGPTT